MNENRGIMKQVIFIIIFILFSVSFVFPTGENIKYAIDKSYDILMAKNIYDTLTESYISSDDLNYPSKTTYVAVDSNFNKEESNSTSNEILSEQFKINVKTVLKSSLRNYPSTTKLDKTKQFVVCIDPTGDIKVYSCKVGSTDGDMIYPDKTGTYSKKAASNN